MMEPSDEDFVFGPFEAPDGRYHRVVAAISGEKVVVQHQKKTMQPGSEYQIHDQEVFKP